MIDKSGKRVKRPTEELADVMLDDEASEPNWFRVGDNDLNELPRWANRIIRGGLESVHTNNDTEEEKVWDLRKQGWSNAEIARVLEIPPKRVRKIQRKALSRLANQNQKQAKQFRDLQTSRIESLMRSIWPIAQGDVPGLSIFDMMKGQDMVLKLLRELDSIWGLKQLPPVIAIENVNTDQLNLLQQRISLYQGLSDAELRDQAQQLARTNGDRFDLLLAPSAGETEPSPQAVDAGHSESEHHS